MLPSSSRKRSLEPPLTTTHPLLQPDILRIVFSYLRPVPDLCQASQVCTTWSQVAETPMLWQHVIVADPPTPRVTPHQTPWPTPQPLFTFAPLETRAAKRARLATHSDTATHLRGVRNAVDVISRRAGHHLHTLLLHRFCQQSDPSYLLADHGLLRLSRRCASSLQHFSVINSRVTFTAWMSFADRCQNLKLLHIIACPNLRIAHIACIMASLPHLEDVSVRNCVNMKTTNFLCALRPVRNTIKRVDISSTPIRQFAISKLAREYPRLEHFVANNCHELVITCGPFRTQGQLNNMFPSLVNLQLNYINYLPPCWIRLVSTYSPKLTAFGASVIDYGSVHSLFDGHAPPIEQLTLAGRHVDDQLWQTIFDSVGSTLVSCDLSRTKTTAALTVQQGQHFSALESLNLADTRATDESVRTIISIAPRLTILKLTRCRGVKDRDFRRNPLRTAPTHREQPQLETH